MSIFIEFLILCCLFIFFYKKRKNNKNIVYQKYEAKNIILVTSASKEELINILAIKYNTDCKNIYFLYNGNIIIDNITQREKWGRNGYDYKIYYPISECMYAENCGREKPQYWENKIISSWKDSWNSAYKKYQSRINLIPMYNQQDHDDKGVIPKLNFYSKRDSVELFGYTITNSIFYTCTSQSDMPFVIYTKSNPSFSNTLTEKLDYWPNYNYISKTQQGYYIKWLANGKPYIEELGYVYIYYYGLEYRALIEKKDLKIILFEVIDLVSKFRLLKYGYALIIYLTLHITDFTEDETNKLLTFYHRQKDYYAYNSTNSVFNAILHKLKPEEKQNIDFYALYSDLYFSADNNSKTNLSSRKYELLSYYMDKMISQIDIAETYSVIQQNYNYYMAMSGYRTPNIAKYEAIVPSKKLRYIWRQAHEIINNEIVQPIKKFDSSTAPLTEIEKLAYLPAKLRNNIDNLFDGFNFGEKSISNIEAIANKLNFKIQDKVTLRQSVLIADACEALGYDIEPNANIDQKSYKKDDNILIYKNKYSEKVYSSDYPIASLFTDLGYLIALEDRELLQVEIAYIENYIKNEFHLSQSEIYRLQMRGELLINTQTVNTNETIKKLIKMVNSNSKENIAKFMISVAVTDGLVKDSEIKILQKIFKQLELTEDYLNLTLSELIKSEDEVVIIENGHSAKRKGSKIPQNIETNEKIDLKLDTKKLEKIKINTSEVQNVLQKIFADEHDEIPKTEPEKNILADNDNRNDVKNGLQNIISIIIEKRNLTRNELLNMIQNKGVMLNGFIDQINEWSEENFGDFLLEENEDIYEVNEDVANLIRNR